MFWWQSSSDAICTRDEEKNKMKKKSCRSKLCLRSDNPRDATEIEFSVCRMVSGGARGGGQDGYSFRATLCMERHFSLDIQASCCSNGSGRPHRRRHTDRFVVFVRWPLWRQCAFPLNAYFLGAHESAAKPAHLWSSRFCKAQG